MSWVISATNAPVSELMEWWLCPNQPRCPHGSVLHDVEDCDDPQPRCCVEGCDCGTDQEQ